MLPKHSVLISSTDQLIGEPWEWPMPSAALLPSTLKKAPTAARAAALIAPKIHAPALRREEEGLPELCSRPSKDRQYD